LNKVLFAVLFAVSFSVLVSTASAATSLSDGTVDSEQKISETIGGFGGTHSDGDRFTIQSTEIGDLDNDGVEDVAITSNANDGGINRGAVWILFLNSDGTVKAEQKITEGMGGFTGSLDDSDFFGQALGTVGDLDGDGVVDLAAGAARDDDGGADNGAVWILFMKTDGTVKDFQKISDTEGGFTDTLSGSWFGSGMGGIGDLDGDGVEDLAVGARMDNGIGAVWILFMKTDGTVKDFQKISNTDGGLNGAGATGSFGEDIANLGDLDGDGVQDVAVGADLDANGIVWILFLNTDGTVKDFVKITDGSGGFTGTLDTNGRFGVSVAAMGDLDADGVEDLAVGEGNGGGNLRGATWILFLNTDGTVKSHQKISATDGNFGGSLDDTDVFGWSLAKFEDLDGNGVSDLAVGAPLDDDGGEDHGALWILFLKKTGEIPDVQIVGGEFIPIETTSLLLASAQTFSWMIPVILSGIGIGLFVVSRKSA